MKFKVGDKVKLVRLEDDFRTLEIGCVYIIRAVNPNGPIKKVPHYGVQNEYFIVYENELELVEPASFTKDDLKDGMTVEFRDNPNCPMQIVLGDLFLGIGTRRNEYMRKCDYDDNLVCRIEGKDGLTIDKVYIIDTNAAKDENNYTALKMDLIWERKEEPQPKEMTIEEIEEALGYPVKVVNKEG